MDAELLCGPSYYCAVKQQTPEHMQYNTGGNKEKERDGGWEVDGGSQMFNMGQVCQSRVAYLPFAAKNRSNNLH